MAKYTIALLFIVTALTCHSAFALEPLDTETMRETRAQAGISIILDDIVLETWTEKTVYTDSDGNGDGVSASIVISNRHEVMTINAITGILKK